MLMETIVSGIAALLTTGAFIPQAYKSFKRVRRQEFRCGCTSPLPSASRFGLC